MLLDSLLPIGAVAIGLMMVMVLIYYILAAEPNQPTDPGGAALDHHPALDDDLLYLASSMYPYQEYAYFPVLPLSIERQEVAQPTTAFRRLSLPLERQEAIQPA